MSNTARVTNDNREQRRYRDAERIRLAEICRRFFPQWKPRSQADGQHMSEGEQRFRCNCAGRLARPSCLPSSLPGPRRGKRRAYDHLQIVSAGDRRLNHRRVLSSLRVRDYDCGERAKTRPAGDQRKCERMSLGALPAHTHRMFFPAAGVNGTEHSSQTRV